MLIYAVHRLGGHAGGLTGLAGKVKTSPKAITSLLDGQDVELMACGEAERPVQQEGKLIGDTTPAWRLIIVALIDEFGVRELVVA